MLLVEGITKQMENGLRFDLRPEREGVSTRFLNSEKAFNIEHLKCAADQLRQSERDVRQITDAISLPIAVFAPGGSVLYGNESLLEYTGLNLSEFQLENSRTLHPDEAERVIDERRTGFADGAPFQLENRMRGKDGQYRWFLVQYRPLLNEQGHIVRWYATGTSIEERKQAEAQARNENPPLRPELARSS